MLIKLNLKTYNNLYNEVESQIENPSGKQTYDFTYNLFVNHPLNTIADFWKKVAFAYSWMPTIPTIHTDKIINESEILTQLKQLQNGQGDIAWLFATLPPIINNSVVGTSKVLHFIAPNEVAIYDSRVILAWQSLFADTHEMSLKNHKGDLNKVLFYTNSIRQWRDTCIAEGQHVSLRDIEKALYFYGVQLAKKEKLKP